MGKFPDDEWRQILEEKGFLPSGATEEVWRNPQRGMEVQIDVDRDLDEPFYRVTTKDGFNTRNDSTDYLREMLEESEPEPEKLTPEEEAKMDAAFLKSMGIVGSRSTAGKLAGRPPRFSFAVPMKSSGPVAFQLAKAGMEDFKVVNYEDDEVSLFTFPSEPEMRVAEDIVKEEFSSQIAARKGQWAMWADEYTKNPMLSPENAEPKRKRYVSNLEKEAFLARQAGKVAGQWGDRSYDSDQVHDILDRHRPKVKPLGEGKGFDEPVPEEALPKLLEEIDALVEGVDEYLGAVVFLATHGSNIPAVYKERALRIAQALADDAAYLESWKNPAERKAELEHEIDILKGSAKTALLLPEDLEYIQTPASGPGMTDAEIRKMDSYRRKKLLAWIDELGLDLSEELKRYDEGDFRTRDDVYEEVREMVNEDRKFQSAYRRTMRGGR